VEKDRSSLLDLKITELSTQGDDVTED